MISSTTAKSATHSLSGKVVLIITGYDQEGESLALSLAERGADLALLCTPENATGAQKIKQQVAQYNDVRCLIFEHNHPGQARSDDAHQTIRRIVEKMGHVDILLDCSRMEASD